MSLGAVCGGLAFASVIVARLAATGVQPCVGANPLSGAHGVGACGAGRSLTPTTPTATCGNVSQGATCDVDTRVSAV